MVGMDSQRGQQRCHGSGKQMVQERGKWQLMHLNVFFDPIQDDRRLLATNSYTASHIMATTGIVSLPETQLSRVRNK